MAVFLNILVPGLCVPDVGSKLTALILGSASVALCESTSTP